ncbi:MAG: phosphotransferase [Gammaproteobacteria bacterium]|nr:phosphotransferase [Gammaproteobacteria bacterium]
MAVITLLSADDIARTLSEYPVGSLEGFKEASEGIENTNYFVRTTQEDGKTGEYVLTLIEEANGSGSNRDAMVKILDRCVAEGLPVPQVIRTVNGASETTLFDKPALLCSKLDGMHVVNPVRSQCAAIGRFLARFHAATTSIQDEVESYVRDSDWLTRKTDTVKFDVSLLDRVELEATLQTVIDLLSRSDVATLPRSVIHADLFLDNALFNTYGLAGILDFHHAGSGYCVYDLAVAINDWCRNGDSIDRDRAVELLRGYSSVRAITQAELWFLPTFLLYAALAFWLSRLLIYIRTDLPAHYPVKDPDEFKDLVKSHTRLPFSVVRESLL